MIFHKRRGIQEKGQQKDCIELQMYYTENHRYNCIMQSENSCRIQLIV